MWYTVTVLSTEIFRNVVDLMKKKKNHKKITYRSVYNVKSHDTISININSCRYGIFTVTR